MTNWGRPEKYKPELLKELIAQMVDGQSLKQICDAAGLVYRVIWGRIQADEGLSLLYARARQDYIHARVASMDTIAMTEPDVQRARLRCDNIKWEAARVLPKDYSDKLNLTHGGNIQHDVSLRAWLESHSGKTLGPPSER